MHIVIIPSWYKVPDRPVVGTFFGEQADMLKKLGLQVGIFYPLQLEFSARWRPELDIRQPADQPDARIPTYYNFSRGLLPWAAGLNVRWLGSSSIRKFRRYVERFGKPDLIHSHAVLHAGVVAHYLSREFEVPFVHTEHLTSLVHGFGPPDPHDRRWVETVLGDARRCIVVGTKFRDDLAEAFDLDPESFEVIPNVVDPRFLDASSIRERSSPFVFFTNSFLNRRKNHELLFRALAEMIDAGEDVRLRVGGYGDIQGELENLVRTLGIEDRVQFLGQLSREEVVRETRSCHAFVLASKYESFGVVLIEAMAVGRPVVCTDSGGPQDIVEPADGILVREHTVSALAEAMTRLVADYERYDQAQISRRCRERFSEEVVGGRLLAIYRSVLG